jgi:hypothetical protein
MAYELSVLPNQKEKMCGSLSFLRIGHVVKNGDILFIPGDAAQPFVRSTGITLNSRITSIY